TGTDAPLVHGPRPKTLLSVEGSGPGRTPRFTTGTDWYLRYSYDCPPNQDGLTVRIFEYSATGAGVEVANETEDTGSDTLPQHTAAGSRYLRITTQCTWTITILG
ncbi:MAG TPA: hypothetical protein VJT31_06885, partial [Rugosimonospora sp.]|nr:hypothetical protein [Rugosimonospora sp.]